MRLSRILNNTKSTKRRSPTWFYLILILIPVLFFVILEMFLVLINYGIDDDQWIKLTETEQMLNPDVARRYFLNTKDVPQSNNDAFDIVKRENTFRVFVLGGSSAQGFPFSPNGTFSRYIRDRLELLYPDNYIEVVNIAITATNSYTIRDLLPEVLEQQPDLILIYAGHNEYYGAFGVGSNENTGNSRSIVNFLIWLNKFKSIQLVRDVISSITNLFNNDEGSNEQGGTLMARIVREQLIPMDSEMFDTGLEQFEGNLEDILQMTSRAEVPVLIGNLVSNLKDQKPFMSVSEDAIYNADSVFNRATMQLELGDTNVADSLFRLAKDLDALRFRAPEKINEIIFNLAQKYNCTFIDIESTFNAQSPDGIVGYNLIVDHLHPSLEGYQLIGEAFFESMIENNLLPTKTDTHFSESEQDSIVVANFAFSHLDSLIAEIRLLGLLNDWPFVEKRDFSFLNQLELKDKIDSIAYNIAVKNSNWEKGHREAADWYLQKNESENFTKEYQVIISQYPFKLSDYDYAASELINVQEYDLAYYFLFRRFKETPNAFSSKWLGNIKLNKGEVDEAIKYLSISTSFDKKDPQVYYNLAGAYIQNQEYKKALGAIEHCLKINPDFAKAQYLKDQLFEITSK
jgi:lysophospholipase L1-like esterase